MSEWKRTGICFLALAFCAFPALADDGTDKPTAAPAGYDMAAMEEAWNKARTPGDSHRFLARLEGEWTYSSKMWMDPSQPPMESGGEARKAMIMDGRYLQEEFSGVFNDEPFNGRGLTAFDNVAGEFISTWIDSMGTGLIVSRGQRDEDTLTVEGEMLDPTRGQPMKLRMVTRIVDDDHHTFDYFVTAPGMPEIKQMVIEYSRKAAE